MNGRSYDQEYTKPGPGPTRIRAGQTIEQGSVVRFVRQLEYRIGDEWLPVVRYDHGPAPGEHDVTDEGLHIDVYCNGEKVDRLSGQIALPESANRALTRAEDHLVAHAKQYIKRFEQWHDLNPDRSSNP